MSDPTGPETGLIGWTDLTVPDAEGLEGFYRDVVGWRSSPVEMGGYSDFTMSAPASGNPVAGICHARGTNADLPPVWLIYITVEGVERSAARCREVGGKVVVEPKDMGSQGRYCVIEDPAGAFAALYEPAR